MGTRIFAKFLLIVSMVLTFVLLLGTASQALAAPEEQIDVIISFATNQTTVDEDLICNNGGTIKQTYHVVLAIAASIPKNRLEILRRDPRIASIVEDIPVQIGGQALPGGLGKTNSTSLNAINKGTGVKVAVLDTGIDLDHPDLKVAGNVSFVDGTVNGDDDNGHGTIVAGIIAALDNGTGTIGVAPEVALYSVKVLNKDGDALMRWVLGGIQWAIDNRMQVINMSFGSPMNMPEAIIAALDNAYKAGIVIVAGAGNSGTPGGEGDNVWSPARYAPVIAVGSVDSANNRYSTSSTGYQLELVAPGVNINSTAMGGGYGSLTGTSASSPYAAGVAAVLISSGITDNTEVRKRMRSSAVDLGEAGWDLRYGSGKVDADTALNFVEPPDKTAPTTQMSSSGKVGRNGWYLSDVTISLSAVDNAGGSGIARIEYSLDNGTTWNTYTSTFAVTSEGRYIPVMARSRDNAGNLEGPAVSVNLKIDKTAPVITETTSIVQITSATTKGTLVEVLFKGTAEDSVSMVDAPLSTVLIDEYGTYSGYLTAGFQGYTSIEAWADVVDPDGRTYTFRFTAFDAAGNTAFVDAVVTVLPIDKTAPSTQISLSGTTGRNGWYISDVIVTLSAIDNAGGSGVAQTEYSLDSGESWGNYTAPFTLTAEGRQFHIMARSRDNAGNIEKSSDSARIKIDKTAPIITVTTSLTDIKTELIKGKLVMVQFNGTAEDSLSEVGAQKNTSLIDEYGEYSKDLGRGAAGKAMVEAWCKAEDMDGRTYTFRYTVYDADGNSSSADAIVTVRP